MNAFEKLIGESPEFQSVIRSAEIVAATDVTVLIEGDTGTGKELLAQALHTSSNRSDKSFITINCAALPESLGEAERGGQKKGAFTDSPHNGKNVKPPFLQAPGAYTRGLVFYTAMFYTAI